MNAVMIPSYVSALRTKVGELTGLSGLAPDIADKVLPRLIVPPPKERDTKLQKELFRLPERPTVHNLLGRFWMRRPALLQCTYLINEIGAPVDKWLPPLFWEGREHELDLIPTFTLTEAAEHCAPLSNVIDRSARLKLALVVASAEIVNENLFERVARILEQSRIDATECAILIDFADADMSDPAIVAPIIRGAFETVQAIGPWRLLAFQGTNFPEHNPAGHGSIVRVERGEWLAWMSAVGYCDRTPDHFLFGDYAADCAKLNFGKGRARAIRHLRYATDECWFVVRADEKGRDAVLMQDVCQRIINGGWYGGRGYSVADDQIFRIAHRMRGPGTASDWRAINTGRHITHVVRNLGAVKEIAFATLEVSEFEEPPSQFPHLLRQDG